MPKTINDAVISVVSTGRRMQTSEMFMSATRDLGCAHVHGGTVRQQQLAFGHDGLAAVEPGSDHTFIADLTIDFHRLDLGGAVLDDEYERAGLADLHGIG